MKTINKPAFILALTVTNIIGVLLVLFLPPIINERNTSPSEIIYEERVVEWENDLIDYFVGDCTDQGYSPQYCSCFVNEASQKMSVEEFINGRLNELEDENTFGDNIMNSCIESLEEEGYNTVVV